MKLLQFVIVLLALDYITCFGFLGKPNCGGESSLKKIELINPALPPRECHYRINAYSKYVCQLRIEFAYTLAQPTVKNGVMQCNNDSFEAGDLKLCGTENAQHIYLPFNRTAGVKSVDLLISLANRVGVENLPTPQWKIKVTQLECPRLPDSLLPLDPVFDDMGLKDEFFIAPPGCLQYFPYPEGSITSFNFNGGNGAYPGKLNYAVCFRRTGETKSLILKPKSFDLGIFFICNTSDVDYLMIPQAHLTKSGAHETYFCGASLQGDIISTNPGPLMFLFKSQGNNKKPSGFNFNYEISSTTSQ